MLVLIKGENGSGKTFLMTIFALALKEKNVWANYWVKHPNYKFLEIDDLLHIPNNTDIFIDEAYNWLENRRSGSNLNVFISEIKEQKRKSDSTWYLSEARPKLLDKRFEQFPNVIVQCKTRYPIGHSTEDFVYKFTYDEPYAVVYKTYPYQIAEKYFGFFNTKERTKMHNQDKFEFKLIEQNPPKLMSKIQELAKLLLEKDNNIKYTHDKLKMVCLENGIIKDYEPYLYLYFKRLVEIEKEKTNDV